MTAISFEGKAAISLSNFKIKLNLYVQAADIRPSTSNDVYINNVYINNVYTDNVYTIKVEPLEV